VVVQCVKHRKHFTLYPPGYAPYQRLPVVQLAPDGSAKRDQQGKALTGASAFEGTVFQAALDAKQGHAWARNSERGVPDLWWNTQRRHLALALRLTGVSDGVDDALREQLRAALGVDPFVIRGEARRELSGYQARGCAVWRVLRKVPRGRGRASRLLLCGHLVAQWGEPWSWNPARRTLERLPFLAGSTAAPT
jgi:hypothetical protein